MQPNTACSQLTGVFGALVTGVFGALGRILGKAPIITAWRRLKRLLLLVFIWIDRRIINPMVSIIQIWLLLPAAISLGVFAWLLTLHPTVAGQEYPISIYWTLSPHPCVS
ncbi:hypothetical protein BAE47_16460 [Acidithiobacillus thiooxidans]|uniref:Uncharacterized protein n=1 Tax=Acidithiobacillus thiooxidans TaxID=930 RepID=A0A1C2I542_ACITH|nr:hypothetical protein A6M23_12485 [Acidithiobacillus thiooxidans]OCX73922.1 hypothetical protein A6P07_07020 [Acidithiobacillus thiooxidans]OCX81764.1 hypothetical protein A6O26_12115 [Acidithiobacillus thiooxidans]OFC42093.1 hypothetical protein BAE47_16460 [Acidithiobacillus thiooxidans]